MSDDDRVKEEDGDKNRHPGRYESEMDEFAEDEFGGPLFGTGQPAESGTTAEGASESGAAAEGPSESDDGLSFGSDDTGPLRHWTEPATGEVPKIEAAEPAGGDDDVDVWSSFTTDSPVWKEGDHVDDPSGVVSAQPTDPTGELAWEDAPADEPEATAEASDSDVDSDPSGSVSAVPAAGPADAPREPGRITIGTDPSGVPRRPDPKRRGATPQRPPGANRPATSGDRRNLPIAVASGVVLAAVFLVCVMWRPAAALVFITVLLGLASIEYFSKVTEKGYRPVVAAGVAACVAAPLAAYWVGETAFPIVIAFGFFAGAVGFIGAESIESGPMPNMAITTLGVVWIGVLGAFAALILRWSTFGGGTTWGTDTLVLLAVGVVANDVGAYFVGTAFGRTPLRAWISPNKSVEGFLGGAVLTLVVMLLVGLQDWSDTWSSTTHLMMLGVVISVMAPLGDLTESMFKRNLDVKDFGSIIRGHGGVLDRFDGFLFCLPVVYYLFLVVEPWAEAAG